VKHSEFGCSLAHSLGARQELASDLAGNFLSAESREGKGRCPQRGRSSGTVCMGQKAKDVLWGATERRPGVTCDPPRRKARVRQQCIDVKMRGGAPLYRALGIRSFKQVLIHVATREACLEHGSATLEGWWALEERYSRFVPPRANLKEFTGCSIRSLRPLIWT
jgi:hypothetical protein